MSHTVFLTGSTGNVGAALLARLLSRDDVAEIVALVRADDAVSGLARLQRAVSRASCAPIAIGSFSKIRVICGDLTVSLLGMTPDQYRDIASSVTCIVHAAASTQFTLPLDEARDINRDGTRKVLEFARAVERCGRLRRLVHVSTAYVCGSRSGTIYEDEAPAVSDFANTYEQSKWEAETIVRDEFADLPVTIVRPSVIVGDSRSGRIISCDVLYTPLRWILQGRLTTLFCPPYTPLDVVSTDFVTDAISYLLLDGNCDRYPVLHLTAGRARSMTVGEIVECAIQYVEVASTCGNLNGYTRPRVLWLKDRATRAARQLPLDAYYPYMSVRRDLSTDRRHAILDPAGIQPRCLRDYLSNILEFSLASNWGRRPHPSELNEERRQSCMA